MSNDIAKLLLRLSVGVMMLFHGLDKIINGIDGVKHLLVSAGAPQFLAYGVYVGEVVIPIFIILGVYVRAASVILGLNMVAAIFLAYGGALFSLGKHGAPVFELPFLYLMMSVIIFMLGSGKYALNSK
ncbi:DoxX [Sulfurimonas denitrificans DSM 1251]|jgi:putative oxidoreductase|uniref:DoxX n=1 Tax=Sulfurimonas denitrificans (strain ATCC 33889 / DSM 1251) TaxID=326298 RepID=Q30PP2_SULDN|nr:DoxX family protein [Sulfurimonas denitrificans]ABB45039.1 DoxX [Sulfurimonas denitrificans DSM 1251]MDD3442203.1 DoxX family protein [Sulfurimonas denitrificans]